MYPEHTAGDTFTRAVISTAETMNQAPYAGERLHKAIDLVLNGNVTCRDDGSVSVKSGSHTYPIDVQEGCSCEDARRHSKWCKHAIAVELLKRTQARLGLGDDGMEMMGSSDTPRSAAWHVHESPASCCLRFTLGGMEVMYTMRDVNDESLFPRVRRMLLKLQEKTGNGTSLNGSAQEAHVCPVHQVPMRRYTKGNQSWYAHQTPDGSWCRGR